MNSKYKAALLGVPLAASTVVFFATLISLGGAPLLEGSRIRYLAVFAAMLVTLGISVFSLKAIMNLDRPAGLKATEGFKHLHVKETFKIIFLWACATICAMIILGYFVSDDNGLFGLGALIVTPFIWFRCIQSLKCRAFFIHPDDRRAPASK